MKKYVIEDWLGHFLMNNKINKKENCYNLFINEWTNFIHLAKTFTSENEIKKYIFNHGMTQLLNHHLVNIHIIKK